MAGGRVELPCDINVTSSEDDVTLILWHRDDSGSPLYSLDAREFSLQRARHFPSQSITSRGYFNTSVSPAFLRMEAVQKSDEAVYRCRVEYKRSRTETTDSMLTVIVPPREAIIMDEYGQHLHGLIGPYNEGLPLVLACEGEGGDPSPSVRWRRETEIVDDSFYITPQGFARNDLLIHSLRRTDLLTRLDCLVSNSNLTAPVTSFVTIDMNLKPTEVVITSMYRPLSINRSSEIVCVARGGRPPAQISWWLDGEKLTSDISESSSRDENLTVSSLLLNPGRQDNQRNLSCRGDNPQVPDSVLEDTWILDVHFPPQLIVKIDKQSPVLEGGDVSLTCIVRANPPIAELEWLKDGQSLGPPSRRDTKNRTLNFSSATSSHRGRYQCAALNSEGRTLSNPQLLKVHYVPRCRSIRSRVYGVGRTESVSVSCEVDASPSEVTFAWALDGTKMLTSDQYSSNGSRSVATVSPRYPQDYGLLMCWASNAVGRQREPCTFRIVPAGPPEEPRNCLITNRTHRCLTLECDAGEDLQQVFQLEVFGTDSDTLVTNVSAHAIPVFSICSLPSRESLVLVVYSANNKGRSRGITLHITPEYRGSDEGESGILTAALGILAGGVSTVAIVFFVLTLLASWLRKRALERESEEKKSSKEACVSSGPDIIPDKKFFLQERSDSLPKVIEVDQSTNLSSAQTDPSSNKYRLPYMRNVRTESVDVRSSIETPLISSINPILQDWTSESEERTLRLSTPV